MSLITVIIDTLDQTKGEIQRGTKVDKGSVTNASHSGDKGVGDKCLSFAFN